MDDYIGLKKNVCELPANSYSSKTPRPFSSGREQYEWQYYQDTRPIHQKCSLKPKSSVKNFRAVNSCSPRQSLKTTVAQDKY